MKKGIGVCLFLFLLPLAIAQEGPTISVTGNGFDPAEVEVANGTPVAWVNEWEEISFIYGATAQMRSGLLRTGDRFTFVFPKPGVYTYADVNFGFRGKVTVTDALPEEPEPKPAPEPPPPAPDVVPEPAEPALPLPPTCPEGCTLAEDGDSCVCVCATDDDCIDEDACTVDRCSSEPVRCTHERRAGCAFEDQCYDVGEIANVAGVRSLCSDAGQWVNENSKLVWWGLGGLLIILVGVGYIAFKKPHKPEHARKFPRKESETSKHTEKHKNKPKPK